MCIIFLQKNSSTYHLYFHLLAMKYTKHITDQNLIRITTIDWAGIFWFVIDEDKDFILMLHEDDFRYGWYKIIKKVYSKKLDIQNMKSFEKNYLP